MPFGVFLDVSIRESLEGAGWGVFSFGSFNVDRTNAGHYLGRHIAGAFAGGFEGDRRVAADRRRHAVDPRLR
jgi:hypothetical protein